MAIGQISPTRSVFPAVAAIAVGVLPDVQVPQAHGSPIEPLAQTLEIDLYPRDVLLGDDRLPFVLHVNRLVDVTYEGERWPRLVGGFQRITPVICHRSPRLRVDRMLVQPGWAIHQIDLRRLDEVIDESMPPEVWNDWWRDVALIDDQGHEWQPIGSLAHLRVDGREQFEVELVRNGDLAGHSTTNSIEALLPHHAIDMNVVHGLRLVYEVPEQRRIMALRWKTSNIRVPANLRQSAR